MRFSMQKQINSIDFWLVLRAPGRACCVRWLSLNPSVICETTYETYGKRINFDSIALLLEIKILCIFLVCGSWCGENNLSHTHIHVNLLRVRSEMQRSDKSNNVTVPENGEHDRLKLLASVSGYRREEKREERWVTRGKPDFNEAQQ